MNAKAILKKYTMVIALAAVFALFGFLTKGRLLYSQNMSNLMLQNSYVLVLACGMLLCILTGGNQQKVLLSKWMFADADVLILDEPTRGIDVGAKYEIYCIMNDLVAQGKSVIMISSEMPEILGMCDRIYVMNAGRIVAEMYVQDATQEKIMAAILNSEKNEESERAQ